MIRTILTAAFVILLATEVQASQCNTPKNLKETIAENWNERIVSMGTTPGGIVRLYVNLQTGTWTMTMIRMSGTRKMECVMSSGDDWQMLNVKTGDPA